MNTIMLFDEIFGQVNYYFTEISIPGNKFTLVKIIDCEEK